MRRANYSSVKRAWPLGAVIVLCFAPLHSATLERLSLSDMAAKSTVIQRAKVLDSYASYSGSAIYTHYKLQVSESLKGISVADVAVPGGVAGGTRQIVPGAPSFQTGDEYVFFLWTGKNGLSQVVGLTQGLFRVAAGNAANPTVVRNASHELMLDHNSGHAVKDETLTMSLSDLRSQIAGALAARTGK